MKVSAKSRCSGVKTVMIYDGSESLACCLPRDKGKKVEQGLLRPCQYCR